MSKPREETFIDLGGVRLTKSAASMIAVTLISVPNAGQYALTAAGIIDPSGMTTIAEDATSTIQHITNIYK